MVVKPDSIRNRRHTILAWIALLIAAPVGWFTITAQETSGTTGTDRARGAESPVTSTPGDIERVLGRIAGSLWHAQRGPVESPAESRTRPVTAMPNDIERSLGQIAGSLSKPEPQTRLATQIKARRVSARAPVTAMADDIERSLGSLAGSFSPIDVSNSTVGERIEDELTVTAVPEAIETMLNPPAPAAEIHPPNTLPETDPAEPQPTRLARVPEEPAVSDPNLDSTLAGPGNERLPIGELPATLVGPSTANFADNIPNAPSRGPYQNQLDPYLGRALEIGDDATQDSLDSAGSEENPIEFGMWWNETISQPLGLSDEFLPIDVAALIQTALVSSPYIQAILTEPAIRRQDLVIADAEFDATAFVEAKFADTNEPVGSQLTTGVLGGRYLDQTFSSSAGLRRKLRRGGSLDLVQRGGFQNNNSTFLFPNPQGTSRLEINFTQPLLKNHGLAVNNTQVLLAQIDVQLAKSDVRADLENHLIDVTNTYWELYQARAEWMQRNRLLERAQKLYEILQARGQVDSQQRQILRAEVAVTSRRSDLVRAETRIRNAQARLRLLTGDTALIRSSRWELTPQDKPLALAVALSTRDATLTALQNRPDVTIGLRRIQAVAARVGAAKNQVLPRLDLLLTSYVAGLEGNTDPFGAWVNQFREGGASYAAGLLYEIPLGNRASKARLARNRLEMTRTMREFEQTAEVVFADVEVAVRETKTAFDEMFAKKQAIDAAVQEVDYLQQRWELLPDPNESAVLLIENLLDAQERLADEERAFTVAQVGYAKSWVRLRKSMGVLLRFDDASHEPYVPMQSTAPAMEVSPDSSLEEIESR